MKKIRLTLVGVCLAVACMSLTSCMTQRRAVNQLESFSQELKYKSRYYNADDWKVAADKFIKIRKNINKYEFDYTPEEKARIGQLEGECAGYMAKGVKEGFLDKVNNVKNELIGILEGILHSVLH